MTRQRHRHASRLPIGEALRLRIDEFVSDIGSLYIEVQDHGSIHGILIQVELNEKASAESVTAANDQVQRVLRELVAGDPGDVCLAGWLAAFTKEGRTIATSWQTGSHVAEADT